MLTMLLNVLSFTIELMNYDISQLSFFLINPFKINEFKEGLRLSDK